MAQNEQNSRDIIADYHFYVNDDNTQRYIDGATLFGQE